MFLHLFLRKAIYESALFFCNILIFPTTVCTMSELSSVCFRRRQKQEVIVTNPLCFQFNFASPQKSVITANWIALSEKDDHSGNGSSCVFGSVPHPFLDRNLRCLGWHYRRMENDVFLDQTENEM